MTIALPKGRYVSLGAYAERIGVNYHTLRARIIAGTARVDYYRVGRACLIRI